MSKPNLMKHSKSFQDKKKLQKLVKEAPNNNETSSEMDSEDDENLVRVGRVPRQWYDDFKHVGYDINAQ